MRQKFLTLFLVFAVLGGSLLNPAVCSFAGAVAVTSISMSTSSVTIIQGETFRLTVRFNPSNATNKAVRWASSNSAVAAVSGNGTISAKNLGSCTVTATSSNNKTAKCTVTVKGSASTIVSVNAVSVTTTAGTAPSLPSTVTVKMGNGSTKSVSVKWGSISSSQYANAGTFKVSGTVSGTSIKATATVTVLAASGNTLGNIINNGIAAQQGGWIYFQSNDNCIYKVKVDGTGLAKLNDSSSCDINVAGGWIYYVDNDDNGSLCKMKTDGSGVTKLTDDNCYYVNVTGNWIYYAIYDGNGLYKIKTDGTGETELTDDQCDSVNVVNNWIYYINDSDGNSLYKIKTDGSGEAQIDDDEYYCINVSGDWIYYALNNEKGIYKIKTDGTGKAKLSSDNCNKINVSGGWIYYDIYKENGLYKIKTDGTGTTELCDDPCCWLDVVGDRIFYGVINSSNDGWILYTIQTDGTYRQKIDTSSFIVSVAPVSVTTGIGTAPDLPSTVTVTLGDGTTKSAAVTWDSIAPSKYAGAGTFTVSGTVSGTSIKATATVTVTKLQLTDSQFESYLNSNFGSLTIDGDTVDFTWKVNSFTMDNCDNNIITVIDDSQYKTWLKWCTNNHYSDIKAFLNKVCTAVGNNYPDETFFGCVIYQGVWTSDPSQYFPPDDISYDSSTGTWDIIHISADFSDSDGVEVKKY